MLNKNKSLSISNFSNNITSTTNNNYNSSKNIHVVSIQNRINSSHNNKLNSISSPKLKHTHSTNSLLSPLNSISNKEEETMFKDVKKAPFKEYSTRINSSLARYHGVKPEKILKDVQPEDIPKVIWTKEPHIPKHEKDKIKQIFSFNRFFKKNKYYDNKDTSSTTIQITVDEPVQLYKNPFDSLKAIIVNHQVYDEINKSAVQRQQQCFDESVSAIESMSMKFKVKMPKIRIIPLVSRNFYQKPDDYDDGANIQTTFPKQNNKHIRSLSGDNTLITKHDKNMIEYSNLLAYHKYPNKNFPEGKQQFSISLYQNELLLFGGMSSIIKSTVIWSLNLESLEWKRIPANTLVPYIRYGHTSTCIKNKLFLFGGRSKFIDNTEYSQYEYFNLDLKTWQVPVFNKNGIRPPLLRRNHIGELIGQQYLIHGGSSCIDESVLNDAYVLNTSNLKWSSLESNPYTKAPYLYGHTCALVVPYEIRISLRVNVYNFPLDKRPNNIKEKGLYIFGGVTYNGKLSNVVYNLTLGMSNPEWKVVQTKGKAPLARYFHSMNYYEKGNFIIIHGGRNDYKSDSFALNDTFILNMLTYEWMEVMLYSTLSDFKVLTRCGHSGIIYNNKLVIFGGMNANNYLGSSLFVICLDTAYKNKIKSTDEALRKKMLNNYAMVKQDKQAYRKYQYLMRHNQLDILPEYTLPKIQ